MEARSHRCFGHKTLGAGFVEVVAALGTGVSVILPSLMIGIDQRIVAERGQTFGEPIEGVLLCAGEHVGFLPERHYSRLRLSDNGHYHISNSSDDQSRELERADRRELLKLLVALDAGDVVTVTRIDRLARSTFDLFAIVKRIVDAKAQLAEPWANTGTGA